MKNIQSAIVKNYQKLNLKTPITLFRNAYNLLTLCFNNNKMFTLCQTQLKFGKFSVFCFIGEISSAVLKLQQSEEIILS